jgi:hypothetical protein
MLKKSRIAAALAAAALASAALASSAAATPIDQVTLDTPGHEFSFGNNCAPGLAPALPGELDWQENAAQTTIKPRLRGQLCLQGTNSQARMSVVYHDASHNVVSKFSSNPATGNNSPLNIFLVDAQGARVSSTVVTHVLIRLEVPDPAGGWDSIASASRSYP